MAKWRWIGLGACSLWGAIACGTATTSNSAAIASDAGAVLQDAAVGDALEAGPDGGADLTTAADASAADAPTVDAEAADVGAVDAGTVDAGTVDAGTVDAGAVDAGVADAALQDVAAADATGADAALTDAAAADVPPSTLPAPNQAGPLAIAALDATFTNPSTGDKLAVHAAYPSSGTGPFPAVVIAHGFQLAASQYDSYAERLATFGYVAMTVDYPTNPLGNDNPKQASDLAAGLDWAKAQPTWAGKIDVQHAGIVGHSLGGKLAFLAATLDNRFQAAFGIDPVDGGSMMGCNPPKCVKVIDEMGKLKIATGFVGETTDAKAAFQACAPADSNFQKFFAAAPGPSFAVTAIGANHMSFLDDLEGCGLLCMVCNAAKADPTAVRQMTQSFMVAFFERHLRGMVGYDAWLTGANAQQKFVATGLVTIAVK